MRRADRARRRLSPPPDRAGPSRRGLRAARGPGRGEEARRRNRWSGATSCAWSPPARSPRSACSSPAARTFLSPCSARRPRRALAFGLAALDISTGAFKLSEADEAGLAPRSRASSRARSSPRRPSSTSRRFRADRRDARGRDAAGARGRRRRAAERRVYDFYGVETLDGFGAFTRAEIAAAALAPPYLKRTQIDARPALSPPTRRARGARLEIDAATRANLELTRTLAGERDGSLLAAIDLTVTPAGARLLAERLASPLTDRRDRRTARRARFSGGGGRRRAQRRDWRARPTSARALAPGLDRGGPRDLAAIRDGVAATASCGRARGARPLPPELLRGAALSGPMAARSSAISSGACRRPAADQARRRLRRAGASAPLDEARALRDESRRVVAELQAARRGGRASAS